MTDAVSTTPDEAIAPLEVQALPVGPGVLRGGVSLTLNTKQALNLFNGRRPTEEGQHGIPGIYRFANYLDQIAIGAGHDDPYADLTMVKIEDLMDECEKRIVNWDKLTRKKLRAAPGISVEVATSIKPHVIDLKLTSPYAHWAARLIGQYDAFMAVALSAQYVGIVDQGFMSNMINTSSTAFRRPLHVAQDYRFSGITREDIEQNNARAVEVVEIRGAVPDEILSREKQPRFRYLAKSH